MQLSLGQTRICWCYRRLVRCRTIIALSSSTMLSADRTFRFSAPKSRPTLRYYYPSFRRLPLQGIMYVRLHIRSMIRVSLSHSPPRLTHVTENNTRHVRVCAIEHVASRLHSVRENCRECSTVASDVKAGKFKVQEARFPHASWFRLGYFHMNVFL